MLKSKTVKIDFTVYLNLPYEEQHDEIKLALLVSGKRFGLMSKLAGAL